MHSPVESILLFEQEVEINLWFVLSTIFSASIPKLFI
jgi:hypothetical protein